jgi:hypothetical protein
MNCVEDIPSSCTRSLQAEPRVLTALPQVGFHGARDIQLLCVQRVRAARSSGPPNVLGCRRRVARGRSNHAGASGASSSSRLSTRLCHPHPHIALYLPIPPHTTAIPRLKPTAPAVVDAERRLRNLPGALLTCSAGQARVKHGCKATKAGPPLVAAYDDHAPATLVPLSLSRHTCPPIAAQATAGSDLNFTFGDPAGV